MEPDEVQWVRRGLQAEIAELETKITELRARLISVGGAPPKKWERVRSQRKPMSEATKEKLKAAQLKRWAARKRMEEEIVASKTAKSKK